MQIVLEAFRDCGMWGYVDALFGFIGLGLGALALMIAFRETQSADATRNPIAIAALGVGGLVLLVGVGAYLMGLHMTFQALAAVDPALRSKIEALGRHEAQQCIYIGAGFALPTLVLASLALGGVAAAKGTKPS